jgi:hypothetical protein
MEVCENFKKQVEEKVEKPIDEWIEKREEKCKKGKWYNPATWICWFVTSLTKVVRWVVVTVLKWVVYTVCKVINVVLDITGVVLELFKSIPILGSLLNILHETFTFLVNVGASTFSGLLGALGIINTKYLRVTVVIQKNEKGQAITTADNLRYWVEETQNIFRQAKVEVFIKFKTMNDPSPNDNLNIIIQSDKAKEFYKIAWENMGLWMARFRRWMAIWDFEGAGGRLLGIGASLVCYVVQDIKVLSAESGLENKNGFSWGPVEDFVIVTATANNSTLAHEIGHSCLLDHEKKDDSNLMFTPGRTANKLNKSQIFLIRNSKYASIF